MNYETLKYAKYAPSTDLKNKHVIDCQDTIVISTAEYCVFERCKIKLDPLLIENCKFIDCDIDIVKSTAFKDQPLMKEDYIGRFLVRTQVAIEKYVTFKMVEFISCNVISVDFSAYRNNDNVDINLVFFDKCNIEKLNLGSSDINISFMECKISYAELQNANLASAVFNRNTIDKFTADVKTCVSSYRNNGDFKQIQAGDSFSFIYACGNAYIPSIRYFGSVKDISKGVNKVPSQITNICKILTDL